MEHVQTKQQIAALLAAAGLRPRKRLGQHFLIDGNLMRRLATSAELSPNDVVLEVGAGTGGLTDLLAPRVQRVVCVEIDRDLSTVLMDRFRDTPHVVVLEGDVLASKHQLWPKVSAAIRGEQGTRPPVVKLVSNLPYRVATPLVMNLLVDYPAVRRLCFTVQAEVGDRLTARPNTKAYGPLAILAQLLSHIEQVARLPPSVFWPRPAVDSVMIRMDVGSMPFATRDRLRSFAAFVRATFEHRRKTLRQALRYVIDEARIDVVCQRFDATRRPESFDIDEWLAIHEAAGE